MQPSVDLSFQCMQTPTLVYAYSNFFEMAPRLLMRHKKIFLTHHSRLQRDPPLKP
jgi:hypothetical protein